MVTSTFEEILCPLCHSDNVRSKVQIGDEWSYICDNWEDPHIIVLPDGKQVSLRDHAMEHGGRMFYFTGPGKIYSAFGTLSVIRQELMPE